MFQKRQTFVDSLPYIYMNGNYIERGSQANVLGVTISSDLSWNVDEIISKARNDLSKIYVSVIRHVVEYACPLCYRTI